MLPFTVLTTVAAPLEIPKIDTGMILPGRFMRRHRRPGHDYGELSSTICASTTRVGRAPILC